MRLTHRLFGLALVALAPAVAIEVYNEVGTRRAREAEVRELAKRSALQAASELQQVIEGARHLLTAISQVEAVRTFDPTSCVAYFSQLQPDVPYLLSLAAIDREGWLRCREELPSEPVSYTDRPYIQKALGTGRFSLGEYTQARIAKRAVLPMALPLRSNEGATVGVVAAAIDLQWLSGRLLERGLPPEGSITVADRNGTILARQPFPARFEGTSIPDSFQPLLNSTSPGSTGGGQPRRNTAGDRLRSNCGVTGRFVCQRWSLVRGILRSYRPRHPTRRSRARNRHAGRIARRVAGREAFHREARRAHVTRCQLVARGRPKCPKQPDISTR